MDIYMPMSTTSRHNKLINTFIGEVLDLSRKKEIYALQSDCALVHWGFKSRRDDFKYLVDIDDLDDVDDFIKATINDLDFVQPDFMLFKKNKYLCNERETRTAGCPDLIIEIWSKDNSKAERNFKVDLYSSSPVTEHWYIEQDSNEVICYSGRDKLESQSLLDVLVTRGGLEFDLRYLAV
jgi:Uma2 family endonuclease